MEALLQQVRVSLDELTAAADPALQAMQVPLRDAVADLQTTTAWILSQLSQDPNVAMGGAFDYLMQTGYVLGGWHMARSALCARARLDAGSDRPFYQQKIATAGYYIRQILPRAAGHAGTLSGDGSLQDFASDWL